MIYCVTLSACVSYPTLLTSKDYRGDKIFVQRHADPCCGWAGLRFVYKEGKNKEHIIYFNWQDVPFCEKEVRVLDGKKVIQSEKFQLVFDTNRYTEPTFRQPGFGDTTTYDINDVLLSTKYVKPTIKLNRIDSILLFHSTHLLTSVDRKERPMWLLEKAAGYIKGERDSPRYSNGKKAIKK